MAAVRQLEFANIAVLVTWPISACDLSSSFQIRVDRSIWRRDIAKERFSIWRPCAILNLIWRHHIASENWILRPNFVLYLHGVRFRNFWNILYFMFQHFGLKWPISGLILTIFGEKIGKNVKTKYSSPQKAHPWRKLRLISGDDSSAGATCPRNRNKRKEVRKTP